MILRIASNRLIKILAKEYKAAVSLWICFLKTKVKLHCRLRNALKTMLIVFPFQALIFLAFCKIQNSITKGSRYKEGATTFFTLKTCVECFSCLMAAFINVISRGATPWIKLDCPCLMMGRGGSGCCHLSTGSRVTLRSQWALPSIRKEKRAKEWAARFAEPVLWRRMAAFYRHTLAIDLMACWTPEKQNVALPRRDSE